MALTHHLLGCLLTQLIIAGTIAFSGSLIVSLDPAHCSIPLEWFKKSWQASTLGNWFLLQIQLTC
jgi:hypothetical protein